MSNKTAILQLCADTKCLLLQLLHMDYIPQSLRHFLCDSRTTFVGIEIQENSRTLLREYALSVKQKVDLHFPVSYKGRLSLKALAYRVVGLSMRKRSNYKGDWESRVLDEKLVEQACIDAYASYSIARKLLEDL